MPNRKFVCSTEVLVFWASDFLSADCSKMSKVSENVFQWWCFVAEREMFHGVLSDPGTTLELGGI